MKNALNPVTEKIVRIDPVTHPIFKRLFGEAGFTRVDEETIDEFLKTDGLKMVVFADDPNDRKTTLDIAVIAPEIKKAFGEVFSRCSCADFTQARSLAARWGLRSMPAVAIFRDSEFLGAVQGLKPWDEYISLLTEIAASQKAAPRTIAILSANSEKHSECE